MSVSTNPRSGDVEVSGHAVERYRTRVRPRFELAEARVELAQQVGSGEVVAEAPAWARAAQLKPFYLLIGDALALPLAPRGGGWVATTCLVQTRLTARRREVGSRLKAGRAAARRARRRARW